MALPLPDCQVQMFFFLTVPIGSQGRPPERCCFAQVVSWYLKTFYSLIEFNYKYEQRHPTPFGLDIMIIFLLDFSHKFVEHFGKYPNNLSPKPYWFHQTNPTTSRGYLHKLLKLTFSFDGGGKISLIHLNVVRVSRHISLQSFTGLTRPIPLHTVILDIVSPSC